MNLSTVPASKYPLADLAQFVNRGFEAYFVPIEFNPVTFLNMVHKDGIDLTASHVLLIDRQPCGIALIARRGDLRASRLAAMGIAEEARGKGAGSWLMEVLVHEARQRRDREMVLEVIEQNEPAVKLYRRSGFQAVRRLIGFERKEAEEREGSALYKIDLREMGRLVSEHGIPDLPWQLSGETIAQLNSPACAYCKGQAYVAISNVEAEHVAIWSLLVEPQARGKGLGTDLLKSLIAQHTGKTWHVPAILPEELGKVFERAGFEREELSQWQMRLRL
ncbi:MAG TPA: GNAT family N-acetyltransferase [Anaerolineales bacterium]|nr:GNAT family N-acetyltransferase [Anaerolineales bacterium]